ncbi:MAG TPA: hypothetical protein VFX34_04240 [Sporosarcina sp.]|nr:hypothetical protein [Sporosarcina sp.]
MMKQGGFIVTLLAMMFLSGCGHSETNAIYLLPEGYTGSAIAVYNVEGAPVLTYEGDFAVYRINEDGYFATSLPDMQYGTVTDRYYYVDPAGNRTPIDPNCIHLFGTGAVSTDKVDLVYTGIEVTDSCSEEFANSTENFSEEPKMEILNKVAKKFYGVGLQP